MESTHLDSFEPILRDEQDDNNVTDTSDVAFVYEYGDDGIGISMTRLEEGHLILGKDASGQEVIADQDSANALESELTHIAELSGMRNGDRFIYEDGSLRVETGFRS